MRSKIVCVNSHDNNFRSFFDEDRANLFCRIGLAIPFLTVRKFFSAIQSPEFSALHGTVNCLFNFSDGETAPADIAQGMIRKTDWFHLGPSKTERG